MAQALPAWKNVREFAAWWRAGNVLDVMDMATWHKGKGGVNLPDQLLPEWNAMNDDQRQLLLDYARRKDMPLIQAR